MKIWVEIPHGEFLVHVGSQGVWDVVRLSLALRGLWWKQRPTLPSVDDLEPMSVADFVLVASTCPCDYHMDELAKDMGVNFFDLARP